MQVEAKHLGGSLMVSKFVFPPNSYVEILLTKDDGMRRWGLWDGVKS